MLIFSGGRENTWIIIITQLNYVPLDDPYHGTEVTYENVMDVLVLACAQCRLTSVLVHLNLISTYLLIASACQ
jgi:hypothetical protein